MAELEVMQGDSDALALAHKVDDKALTLKAKLLADNTKLSEKVPAGIGMEGDIEEISDSDSDSGLRLGTDSD
eukprot:9123013-Heterocapsa_arctica.AAC.1